MEARHSAAAGSAAAREAGPERTEPRENPPTDDEALATIQANLPVQWVRSFDHHTQPDGSTAYVDPRTGQVYDELPRIHDDGSIG